MAAKNAHEKFVLNRKISVLLIEDNYINQQITQSIFEKLGCQVRSALDGKQAIRLIEKHAFDLAFVDSRLPDTDGVTLIKDLREHIPENKESNCIYILQVVTAYSADLNLDDEHDIDDVIIKPFTIAEVSALLNKWFHAEDTFNVKQLFNAKTNKKESD